MSVLVGWPGQRVHIVETGGGAGHSGGRACGLVPEDGIEPAPVLPEMRRPPYDQSSAPGDGGCVRSDLTDAELQRRRPRQLCRIGAADPRRLAKIQGFPEGIWRLRRN